MYGKKASMQAYEKKYDYIFKNTEIGRDATKKFNLAGFGHKKWFMKNL